MRVLEILGKSHSIGVIEVYTNSMLIDRISENAWRYIDKCHMNIYNSKVNIKSMGFLLKKYPSKVAIFDRRQSKFKNLPTLDTIGKIPCTCTCPGPMIRGKQVFIYCGPPLFGALNLMKTSLNEHEYLYKELAIGWWNDDYIKKIGRLELCKYCWANSQNETGYSSIKDGGNWR